MVDIANLHPNARKYLVSADPKYVTARRKEWGIIQDGPFWRAYPMRGGVMPKSMKTSFLSFKDCERALVTYLRSTENPILKAIYPDEYGSRKAK